MSNDNPKPPKPKIPAWGYLFAGLCILLPILTLGGAIPGAVGFGGAAACVGVSRDDKKSIGIRIALCAAIVFACWMVVGAVVLLVAKARRSNY
jgi:hypothetical protein